MRTGIRNARLLALLVLVLLVAPGGIAPAVRAAPADEPPVRWNLSEIYPTDEAWQAAREDLAERVDELDPFRGRLGSGAGTLKEALDGLFALQMQAERLDAYASMRADEDTREAGPQGMQQQLRTVLADLQAATSWVDPEILSLPAEKIEGFLAREPGLAPYRRYLERLEKLRPHVLDAESEKLLGMTRRIRGVGSTVGTLLRNADIPWPTIELADGTELRVDAQGYTKGRALARREDRIATYAAFYDELQDFKSSLGATLSATVQEHVFEARARHYASSLDAALGPNEIDAAVYRMLVDEVNASLPTLYRYLELRGRILGIDDLRYYDMYPPLVRDVSEDYGWEASKKIVAEALAPLGPDYVKQLRRAFGAGWIDVYPREGKRAGAYVNGGAYEVHPYMLLNFQDDYESTSTLAHESGHLMHSWFSQKAQPYPTSNYSIFVAEVASTVNQVLLFKHLVARAGDDEARLALLGRFLEELRTIVFRQTMFAEFELAIHEMAERGEPLTGESMNALYLQLLRRYHGQDRGVMRIDDLYAAEWAYIPHFHYDFYVYQYATSYVAATALAEGITEGRPGARERYLAFLRAGSTEPPVALLRDAGVDMTTPEPIRAAIRLMNSVMDRIEGLLPAKGPG